MFIDDLNMPAKDASPCITASCPLAGEVRCATAHRTASPVDGGLDCRVREGGEVFLGEWAQYNRPRVFAPSECSHVALEDTSGWYDRKTAEFRNLVDLPAAQVLLFAACGEDLHWGHGATGGRPAIPHGPLSATLQPLLRGPRRKTPCAPAPGDAFRARKPAEVGGRLGFSCFCHRFESQGVYGQDLPEHHELVPGPVLGRCGWCGHCSDLATGHTWAQR